MDLLAQSKWSEAVAAYKAHLSRPPGPFSSDLDWHGVGTRSVEDDIHSMLNLYCKHLQANVIEPLQPLASGTLMLLFATLFLFFNDCIVLMCPVIEGCHVKLKALPVTDKDH